MAPTFEAQIQPAMGGVGVPRIWSCRVQHSDLTVAAGSEKLTIGRISALDVCVLDCFTKVTVAFSGGTASDVKHDVGADARGGNEYLDGAEADLGGWEGVLTGVKGGDMDGRTAILGGDDDVSVTVIATGDTVDNLDAGDMTVYIRYYELP